MNKVASYLEISKLDFSYSKEKSFYKIFRKPGLLPKKALEEINLNVESGQLFGLIGNNGAGKSTLIKLVMGMLSPQSGIIDFSGQRPDMRSDEWRAQIGYVGGAGTKLFSSFNLAEHVALYSGLYPYFSNETLASQLEKYGLDRLLNKFYSQISFGERILFELLLTIACQPRLLLLDEPTVGVDPIRSVEIRQIITRYCAETNACGILTSHNLRDVIEVCQTGAFLSHGKLCRPFNTGNESVQSLEQKFIEEYRMIAI